MPTATDPTVRRERAVVSALSRGCITQRHAAFYRAEFDRAPDATEKLLTQLGQSGATVTDDGNAHPDMPAIMASFACLERADSGPIASASEMDEIMASFGSKVA